MKKFQQLSRAEMKNVSGGYCMNTDNNPVEHCAPGANGCSVQCEVYCTDTCNHTGTPCATYSECGGNE